jgi:serine/threonine protein kinase
MELCTTSLDRVFLENNDPNKYNGPMPSNDQAVLLQLANGLGYLHSLKILHGDIKPENILISSSGESVQMKWTGFGFRKSNLNDACSTSISQSATRMGSRRWWAPETYKDEANVSEIGETFSAGCVFLYFLSKGLHPFANPDLGEYKVANNVTNGKIVNRIGIHNFKQFTISKNYCFFIF